MSTPSAQTVYYLPGHGGRLDTGLGQGMLDRGVGVTGRETRGSFNDLAFSDQVQTVADDLKTHFWREDARVICNSFGAYLFLHAQAQLPPFVGRVVLLSPIVGEFTYEESRTTFSPPRATRLRELAEAGRFNPPRCCELHVGEEDWQSNPANVQAFGKLTGMAVTVVPNTGHDLGKAYVGALLDRWLATTTSSS